MASPRPGRRRRLDRFDGPAQRPTNFELAGVAPEPHVEVDRGRAERQVHGLGRRVGDDALHAGQSLPHCNGTCGPGRSRRPHRRRSSTGRGMTKLKGTTLQLNLVLVHRPPGTFPDLATVRPGWSFVPAAVAGGRWFRCWPAGRQRSCWPRAPPPGWRRSFASPLGSVLLAIELLLFEFSAPRGRRGDSSGARHPVRLGAPGLGRLDHLGVSLVGRRRRILCLGRRRRTAHVDGRTLSRPPASAPEPPATRAAGSAWRTPFRPLPRRFLRRRHPLCWGVGVSATLQVCRRQSAPGGNRVAVSGTVALTGAKACPSADAVQLTSTAALFPPAASGRKPREMPPGTSASTTPFPRGGRRGRTAWASGAGAAPSVCRPRSR